MKHLSLKKTIKRKRKRCTEQTTGSVEDTQQIRGCGRKTTTGNDTESLTAAARDAKLKVDRPGEGTTSIAPDAYRRNRIVGWGDVLNSYKEVLVTGERSTQGDSSRPDVMAHSARRFGVGNPGSERFNFMPRSSIYDLIENYNIFKIGPVNRTIPNDDDTITFTVEQQPGLFLDSSEMLVEMDLQMYHDQAPWETVAACTVKHRKCISPINNVGPSLFKSLIVQLNDTVICNYEYSAVDYMATMLGTPTDVYANGDTYDQGYWKEAAGHLTEWDGFSAATDDNAPPKNNLNDARTKLLNLFWQGGVKTFCFKLRYPLTQSTHMAPLNFGNRLTLTFQCHSNAYYLLSGPNNSAVHANIPQDLATVASMCKLWIKRMQLRVKTLQLDNRITAAYVQSYTDLSPDTYVFQHHKILYNSYQPDNRNYDIPVACDMLPDKIAIVFRRKTARLGSITENPYIFYRLPKDTKIEILCNGSSVWRFPLESTRDQYVRMRKTLNLDTDQPLIQYIDLMVNDQTAVSDCQYNLYCDTLTLTGRLADGSICQDLRQAALSVQIELPAGKVLDPLNEMMINMYDFREIRIPTRGTPVKNFVG